MWEDRASTLPREVKAARDPASLGRILRRVDLEADRAPSVRQKVRFLLEISEALEPASAKLAQRYAEMGAMADPTVDAALDRLAALCDRLGDRAPLVRALRFRANQHPSPAAKVGALKRLVAETVAGNKESLLLEACELDRSDPDLLRGLLRIRVEQGNVLGAKQVLEELEPLISEDAFFEELRSLESLQSSEGFRELADRYAEMLLLASNSLGVHDPADTTLRKGEETLGRMPSPFAAVQSLIVTRDDDEEDDRTQVSREPKKQIPPPEDSRTQVIRRSSVPPRTQSNPPASPSTVPHAQPGAARTQSQPPRFPSPPGRDPAVLPPIPPSGLSLSDRTPSSEVPISEAGASFFDDAMDPNTSRVQMRSSRPPSRRELFFRRALESQETKFFSSSEHPRLAQKRLFEAAYQFMRFGDTTQAITAALDAFRGASKDPAVQTEFLYFAKDLRMPDELPQIKPALVIMSPGLNELSVEAAYTAFELFERLEDHAPLERLLRLWRDAHPSDAIVLRKLAECYERMNAHDHAARAWEAYGKGLRFESARLQSLGLAVSRWAELRNWKEVDRLYGEIMAATDNYENVVVQKIELLARFGEWSLVDREISHLQRIEPAVKARILDTVGTLAATHGDTRRAADYWEAAFATHPDRTDLLEKLRNIYESRGDVQRAAAFAGRELSSLAPDLLRQDEVQQFLDWVQHAEPTFSREVEAAAPSLDVLRSQLRESPRDLQLFEKVLTGMQEKHGAQGALAVCSERVREGFVDEPTVLAYAEAVRATRPTFTDEVFVALDAALVFDARPMPSDLRDVRKVSPHFLEENEIAGTLLPSAWASHLAHPALQSKLSETISYFVFLLAREIARARQAPEASGVDPRIASLVTSYSEILGIAPPLMAEGTLTRGVFSVEVFHEPMLVVHSPAATQLSPQALAFEIGHALSLYQPPFLARAVIRSLDELVQLYLDLRAYIRGEGASFEFRLFVDRIARSEARTLLEMGHACGETS
nr:hypothetical protein [Polyangiaceae bacterium]